MEMKDDNFKYKLIKWHFYLLGFILLNFGIEILTGYRLNQNLTLFFKIVLYLSGIILFFKSLRPFKVISIYFSFYTISAVITGLFFLFGGIFLAILSSIFLYPIYPKQTEYKTQTIEIYDKFQGFMSSCCSYEVVEPKLYIFEKHLGFINIDKPIDPNKDEFILHNKAIIYKYQIEDYNYDNQTKAIRDTTEILKLEK